jgi:hypothetical protein
MIKGLHQNWAELLLSQVTQIDDNQNARLTAVHSTLDEPLSFVPVTLRNITNSELLPMTEVRVRDRDTSMIAIDPASETLNRELLRYVSNHKELFIKNELSHFMYCTLEAATKVGNSRVNPDVPMRNDELVARVLELWCNITVLMNVEQKWITAISRGTDADPREISQTSYKLITTQLKAEAEKRADYLTRIVLSELEKKLFQRAQSGWFETFLVSIILTACLEKHLWILESWAQNHDPHEGHWRADDDIATHHGLTHSFVKMLEWLLRLGGLNYKIRFEQGVLRSDSDEMARKYFESIRLTGMTIALARLRLTLG